MKNQRAVLFFALAALWCAVVGCAAKKPAYNSADLDAAAKNISLANLAARTAPAANKANNTIAANNATAASNTICSKNPPTASAVKPDFKNPQFCQWSGRNLTIAFPGDKWEFVGDKQVNAPGLKAAAFNQKLSALAFKPKNVGFAETSLMVLDYTAFLAANPRYASIKSCNELTANFFLETLFNQPTKPQTDNLSVDGVNGIFIRDFKYQQSGERATEWFACQDRDGSRKVYYFAAVMTDANFDKYSPEVEQIIKATDFE